MYKKIKNGSFMNWIWFILCLLPLIFIVFSLNNENNQTKIYNNEFSYIDNNTNLYLYDYDIDNGDISYDVYNNSMLIIDEEPEVYFSFSIYIEEPKTNWYYMLVKLPYKVSVFHLVVDTYEDTNVNVFDEFIDDNKYFDYIVLSFQYNFIPNEDNLFPLNFHLSYEYNEFDIGDYEVNFGFFVNENYIENERFEGFPNEIVYQPFNYWFNEFISKGFIYNAFMNLGSFFGVTSLYYQLAYCYIEYLLIIVLLHLAFDVLYMLPNICHKFMEKIGGERD